MVSQKRRQELPPLGTVKNGSAFQGSAFVDLSSDRRSLLQGTEASPNAGQAAKSPRVLVLNPNSGGEPNPDREELYLSDLVSARGSNFVASRLSPAFCALRQLRVLWLSRNKLRSIEALQGCR